MTRKVEKQYEWTQKSKRYRKRYMDAITSLYGENRSNNDLLTDLSTDSVDNREKYDEDDLNKKEILKNEEKSIK